MSVHVGGHKKSASPKRLPSLLPSTCKWPFPDYLPPQARVVVIGDIHGDYEALQQCLIMSECVDPQHTDVWVAWGVALVVLGDVVDRYRPRRQQPRSLSTPPYLTCSAGERYGDELRVLALLNLLAQKARLRQSWVYRLVGNHEYTQSVPDPALRYQRWYASQTAVNGRTDDAYRARQLSFQLGAFHEEVGFCHPKVAVQIGTHVFCHGGFNEGNVRYATEHGMNIIEEANSLFAEYWSGRPYDQAAFQALAAKAGPGRGGTQAFGGILWDDTLSVHTQAEDPAFEQRARTILADLERNLASISPSEPGRLPARVMVVSHCVQSHRQGEALGWVPALQREAADWVDFTTRGAPAGGRYVRTPDDNRTINALFRGLAWRVDVGMSRAFEETHAANQSFSNSSRPAILIIEEDGDQPVYTVRQARQPLPLPPAGRCV
jgi:hypothetical protein